MSFLGRLLQRCAPASPFEVERREFRFYLDYVREGMTVFDVGANVGDLTNLFSTLVSESGKVHAFEASSSTFEHLSNHCRLTGRKNVVLNRAAVTDQEGLVKLYLYGEEHSSWNSLACRPLATYGITVQLSGTEEVPAITVDTYCRAHGVERVDLLKVDVEGAEFQVLLGARRMLQEKRIACCVFEYGATTYDMGNNPETIEELLAGCGYRVRNIVEGEALFPGRGDARKAIFAIHIAEPRG